MPPNSPPELSLDDFNYELPAGQIARRPPRRRDGARLLDARGDAPRTAKFSAFPSMLRAGDVLVLNDSKVFPARLAGKKETGGAAEIFAERFMPGGEVLALVGASKPPAPGARIFAGGWFSVLEKRSDGFYLLRAEKSGGEKINARTRFMRRGQTPLPPYIRRPPDAEDKIRYQTVFARGAGSAAAPTAGLHFTEDTFRALAARGIKTVKITLHVGAGTFLPPRVPMPKKLHSERYKISAAAAAKINAATKRGGRIVAAGTTVLRALESAADKNGIRAADSETGLFIKPGRRFRSAALLLTNFHLPRSTLLALACAFGGTEKVLNAYRFAVNHKFRFYSYGDAMLLSRPGSAE